MPMRVSLLGAIMPFISILPRYCADAYAIISYCLLRERFAVDRIMRQAYRHTYFASQRRFAYDITPALHFMMLRAMLMLFFPLRDTLRAMMSLYLPC